MMRRRLLLAALGAAVLVAAVPSAASASYYMGKSEAQSDARDYVHGKYELGRVSTSCRPQGARAPQPGYVYHRWVCGWADADWSGAVLITGSKGRGYYYGKVLRGIRPY